MKKVTMQDIADALNISRVSVWKVFSNRDGVSKELRTQVIAKAAELNYNIPEELKISPPAFSAETEQSTVSVTVSKPEASPFWMTIIHEIAKELTKYNINLLYTYLPSELPEHYELPAIYTNGTIQGMIVLNIYNEQLLKMLNNLSLPKVFMDTIPSMSFDEINGDLLLIEGTTSIAKIVHRIIESKRTKIAFVGDIQYAKTNYDRFQGFLNEMEANHIPVQPSICLTKHIGAETYPEELHIFLDSLPFLPQAFVCVNDYIAHIIATYYQNLGYHIPEDIMITGFDRSDEFPTVSKLPTVQIQKNDIGIRLARQLFYRMEYPNASFEVTYIYSQVLFRNL